MRQNRSVARAVLGGLGLAMLTLPVGPRAAGADESAGWAAPARPGVVRLARRIVPPGPPVVPVPPFFGMAAPSGPRALPGPVIVGPVAPREVDPGILVERDAGIDPNIIVAADPSIDEGIFAPGPGRRALGPAGRLRVIPAPRLPRR